MLRLWKKKKKKKKKESVIHMETNILGNYIVWYLGQWLPVLIHGENSTQERYEVDY